MLDTANARIEALARRVVEELAALAREEVGRMLGGQASGRSPTASTTRNSASRGKGAKRDPAELDKLAAQFLAFVTEKPGLRIEQINAELGTSTKALVLPIKKLLAAKAIKTTGTRRSTKYFAAGAKAAAKKTAGKAAGTARKAKHAKR